VRFRGLLIGGMVTLLGVAGVLAAPGGAARAARPTAHIAVLSPGSWCWFGDPRAIEIPGRSHQIVVGWISPTGGVTVASYDAHLGVLLTRVVGHLYPDDHSSPSLFLEPDQRITVFYSGHNGAEMHYRTTERPGDISTWGPVLDVPSRQYGHRGFTYPNPVSLSAEHGLLYLFWRGEDWSADFTTRTTTGHWTRVHRLIADHGQRPYVKVDSNGRDAIALAYTNGHPRETLTSVYFAMYRHGWLMTAGGRRINPLDKTPISPQQGQLVYDGRAKHTSAWVWDVALGSSGHPVIVYATFPKPTNHQYWYARWDGRRWVSHFLTDAGPSISPGTIEQQYSGGIALDHSDPTTLFLSRKVDGRFQVERWSTADHGHTWQHRVVAAGGADNVRPVVPRGWSSGPMGLLWLRGRYRSYTTYGTSIAFLR
jgi:hypothetical protein